MKTARFWFMSLCCLLIIAAANGLNMPLRIAIIANAIVVLMKVGKQLHGLKSDRT